MTHCFRSSEDLVHRLFVCIAGVADQLQTNFASDLRNILKCVFLMNSSQTPEDGETKDDGLTTDEQPASPVTDTVTNHERQDSVQEYEDDLEDTTVTNDHHTSAFCSFERIIVVRFICNSYIDSKACLLSMFKSV